MLLTRISTSQSVTLDNGFLWTDEFDYMPIEQSLERAIDGALIVQEGVKQAGRPITLKGAKDSQGWVKRGVLNTIQTWSRIAGEKFTLTFQYPHDTRAFTVIFNHAEGAIEAKPIKTMPTVSDDDYYLCTFKLLEVV